MTRLELQSFENSPVTKSRTPVASIGEEDHERLYNGLKINPLRSIPIRADFPVVLGSYSALIVAMANGEVPAMQEAQRLKRSIGINR